MRDDERRKLENQLMVMGLNGLSDPELIQQMARIINAHPGFISSHYFLIGLLNGCDQEKRREMYDALCPHFTFKPWPFDKYIQKLKEHAANVESHYNPVKVGTEKLTHEGKEFQQVASAEEAEGVMLTMTCRACTGTANFYGLTVVDAVTVARHDGWVRDLVRQKEVCPKCAAKELEQPRGFFGIQATEENCPTLASAAAKRKRKAERLMKQQIMRPRSHAVN